MQQKKIKNLFNSLFTRDESFSLENRLLISTILIGIVVSLLGTIISIIISSSLGTILTAFSVSLVLLIFYYFVSVKRIFKPFIIPVIVVSFIGTSIIWILDGGINGSDILISMIVLILALIIVPGNWRKIVISFFIAIIITIYLIQLYRPDLITSFPSEKARWNDSIITAIYSSYFIFLIIQFLLKNYTLEKNRARENELKLQQSELKLLRLNADKDLFISILAHDLKNPFFNIQGLSELIIEELPAMNRVELETKIKLINSISHSTFSMLEDLLLWTRSQSGKIEFNPHRIDFVKTCKSVIENLKPGALQKNITISCHESNELFLDGDEEMLKIVLGNLISNAIKFTNPGGNVELTLTQTPESVAVTVSDNGVGIPDEIQKDLFDISHKISTSGTNNEKGTGLGLLLCKELVEKHGGNISVESIEGQGSKFKFTLPVKQLSTIKS